MADSAKRLVIDDCSGGRNGWSPAWALASNEVADAVNVDFYRTRFARKRNGLATVSTTFSAGGPFTGRISSLFRHVPGTDEGAAELWAVDDAATSIIGRLAGATTWTAPAFDDAPTGNGWDWTAATIDGKLFLAYQSAVNRLHVWDPVLNKVRRTGIAGGGTAPTAANQGAATAVVFDAASVQNYGAASPATFAHTCAVGATILVVFTRSDAAAVTAVTYNAVALTLLSSHTTGAFYSVWYLVSPASGAHNIVVTAAGSQIGALGLSYTGTRLTGVPDALQLNASNNATITTSVTAVADQSMACYAVADRSGVAPTAGANCTQRATGNAASCMTFFDGNTAITPPGVFTMTANITAASNGSGILFTLAPGTGSYAAVKRYYRVRWTYQVGGITLRRSEPSLVTAAFTPSGTGSAARITQPTPPGEGETHWEIEASDDGVTFYRIATVAIGTTTYDDTGAVNAYNTFPLSALTGTYTLQTSYKFIAADQNRLLGFANWTATEKQARVVLSAVIGSLDVGDAERVDTSGVNSYIDLDEKDSGISVGLCGPLLGSFFVFKSRQVWQLTATGSPAQPYRQDAISKTIGALAHVAIDRSEDKFGNASLYWMSHRGPYRWSVNGLEYIGRSHEDYVLGPTATLNMAATKRIAVTCGYPDKRQVWFWWATGSSNDCNVGGIYDIQTGGWTRVPSSDKWANVRCATLFANTIAAAMSRDLKPYVGETGSTNQLSKADTGTDDRGTNYQAFLTTRAIEATPGYYSGVADALLLAAAAAGVTITATVIGDFGETGKTASGTALLTATNVETRVSRRLQGSALSGDVIFVQYQIGDGAEVSNAWTLDRIVVPVTRRDAAAA